VVALTVAIAETYSTIYNVDIPEYVGPVFAITVIGTAFGYGYITRNKSVVPQRSPLHTATYQVQQTRILRKKQTHASRWGFDN
jgi:uncharacterized protein YbjQ (UPF0145 family)